MMLVEEKKKKEKKYGARQRRTLTVTRPAMPAISHARTHDYSLGEFAMVDIRRKSFCILGRCGQTKNDMTGTL